MADLERIFTDRLVDDGATGERWYLVKGELGVVQVAFMKLPDIPGHDRPEDLFPGGWMGNDVGYHSPEPTFPGQKPRECDLLDGRTECYYSGSSVPAQTLVKKWHESGQDDEVVWQAAEWFYQAKFIDDLPGEPSFDEKMMFVGALLALMAAPDDEEEAT